MSNPPTPAERLTALILHLSTAVNTRGLVGLLARPLVVLIIDRLRFIAQKFARIAARVGSGRYAQRRCGPRRAIERKPRRPDPLPKKSGWMIGQVPDAAAFASALRSLLADAEMEAVLAAAPATLRRPLRSLCRMLGVETPPILALPPAPSKSKPKAPKHPPRPAPERRQRPSRVRYVFGLRYPPPFPDPA